MAKQITNIWTIVLLGFILTIFTTGTQLYAREYLNNPYVTLTDEDTVYLSSIIDIDLSGYNLSSDINKSLVSDNDNEGNTLQDYAVDFFYARSKAKDIEIIVKNIFLFPNYICILLKIPLANILWFVILINSLVYLGLFIAIVYFIRGIK